MLNTTAQVQFFSCVQPFTVTVIFGLDPTRHGEALSVARRSLPSPRQMTYCSADIRQHKTICLSTLIDPRVEHEDDAGVVNVALILLFLSNIIIIHPHGR